MSGFWYVRWSLMVSGRGFLGSRAGLDLPMSRPSAGARARGWRTAGRDLPYILAGVILARASDAAQDARAADAGDGEHEGGGPHGDRLPLGEVADPREALDEPALLLALDLL